jgi:hypothetical protein
MIEYRTVREIINTVILEASNGKGKYKYNLNDQALFSIRKLILEAVGKDKPLPGQPYSVSYETEIPKIIGYNQRGQEIRQNLKKAGFDIE